MFDTKLTQLHLLPILTIRLPRIRFNVILMRPNVIFREILCFFSVRTFYPHAKTPNLEDHPLSAVQNCLFKIFLATVHTLGFHDFWKITE
jgi:hypothetical protein